MATRRPAAGGTLRCDAHGSRLYLAGDGWRCPGWDGEGCQSNGWPVPEESAARVLAGQAYWPGAEVTEEKP